MLGKESNKSKQLKSFGDPVWEDLFHSRGWGKYPSEEAIRFVMYAKKKISQNTLRALDLGCGKGAISWFLRKEGISEVVALDGSPSGLDAIFEVANGFGITNGIVKVLGDITCPASFVGEGERFDIIIDHYSLCSNNYTLVSEAFKNILSLLNPSGYFLTCWFGQKTTGFKTGELIDDHFTYIPSKGVLVDLGPVTFLTNIQIKHLLESAGFSVPFQESVFQYRGEDAVEKIISYACLS